jgi:hypothetical protein
MCFLWVTVPDNIAKQHYQTPVSGVKAGVSRPSEPAKKQEFA